MRRAISFFPRTPLRKPEVIPLKFGPHHAAIALEVDALFGLMRLRTTVYVTFGTFMHYFFHEDGSPIHGKDRIELLEHILKENGL